MPNIFKSFLKPAVNSYVFPDAESLQVEESPEPEGEQAEETPLQKQEPEAPHTAAADALNYGRRRRPRRSWPERTATGRATERDCGRPGWRARPR